MNRIFTTALLVIMAALGMGAAEFSFPVGQFNKLQVDDNVNVVYVGNDGSPSRVTYEGDQRFARAFVISEKNGKLRIQVETEFVDNPELPTLYVYSDFLSNVSNSSNSSVTVRSMAPCPEFSCSMSGNGSIVAEDIQATKVSAKIVTGNGNIVLAGHCQAAVLTMMLGNGTIQADRLEAAEVDCKIRGAGSIGCWAVNKLKCSGLGSTKIYYKGKPEISKKGGGTLYELQ